MDESRFDALTRSFAVSRRQALKLALGAMVAGVLETTGESPGEAAWWGFPRPFPWRPRPRPARGCIIDGVRIRAGAFATPNGCLVCNPALSRTEWSSITDGSTCGGVAGRTCCNGECCSPTECCEGIGICTECGPHCRIGGVDIDAGTVNPLAACEICDPERSPDAWSPLDDGRDCNGETGCCLEGACGICFCEIDGDPVADGDHNPNRDCEACRYRIDPTNWTNRDNGARCVNDNNRVCCDGDCCPRDHCCTLDGCEPCCRIGSEIVADGVVNRANTCQICDASRDADAWTTLPDREPCGPTGNSECCNGECCPSGQCCRNGACAECGCDIGGHPFDPDQVNENNVCEICIPALDRFDWSAAEPGKSCDGDGGTCCGRDCCPKDQCCLLEACGECLCSIGNDNIPPNTPNPLVDCQICDPRTDPFDWTTAPDRTACGDGSRKCCHGVCCDEGLCCLDGACQPCGCLIDGVPVTDQTVDPNNSCQRCDASVDTGTWTLLDDGASCGETDAQCCDGGQCAFCSCLIEDVVIPNETNHPDNTCLYCDVALDPGNWWPRTETTVCGNGNQHCCNGICCDEGLCCGLDDTCQACGCFIDGVAYPDGTPKPGDRCEVCNIAYPNVWSPRAIVDCPPPCLIDGQVIRYGVLNPDNPCLMCRGGDGWSPSREEFCGGNQVCCNGVCCDPGACCTPEGICTSEGTCSGEDPNHCAIDGGTFVDGETNPNNPCQVCQVANNPTGWTAQFGACGPTGEQFCCDGVCCDLGACCNNGAVCDFDACETCVIGGQLWFPEDRNPANGCEMCIANANKFAWTPLPDASWCDEMQITTCCAGICCNPGLRCDGHGQCVPE